MKISATAMGRPIELGLESRARQAQGFVIVFFFIRGVVSGQVFT